MDSQFPIPIQQPQLNTSSDPLIIKQPCVQFPIPIQQPQLNTNSDPLIIKQGELTLSVKHQQSLIIEQEELTLTVKRQRIEKLPEPEPQRSLQLPLPQRFLQLFPSLRDLEHTFIFNRKLFNSDVNPGLMRLTMPRTQILNTFLTDDEENKINQKNSEGKMNKIQVIVIDSKLNLPILTLTRWNYKNSTNWSYILSGGWNEIVTSNGFVRGDEISIWTCRMDGYLIFVIDKMLR